MEDRFQKIFDAADESEKEDLQILQNAVRETAETYKKEPTAINKKNWDVASQGLNELIDRLWMKYFHKEPAFEHRKAVADWLEKEGYKVKRQKVYDDVARGLLKMQDDKSVFYSDVEIYAKKYLEKKKDKTGQVDKIYEQKSKAEIIKTQRQIEKIEFDLDVARGKYILRKDFGMELAARAGMFEAGLKHLVQIRAIDWIYEVKGDPKKAQLLIDRIHNALDEQLGQYASMDEFHVIVDQETRN